MSENNEQPTANAGDNEQPEQSGQSFSQDDVNRIVQERLDRERKKFEGFDEYKAAAAKVADLEATNQTLTDKVGEFEAKEQRNQLLTEVSASKGVPADLLTGSTKEELEAQADKLIPYLKPSGPVVPGQETKHHKVESSDELQTVRGLFGTK